MTTSLVLLRLALEEGAIMGERQQAAGGPRCLPLHAASLDRESQSKPRQDFLDVCAESARLTLGHVSPQVWLGSAVQHQQIQCPVLHESHRSSESTSLRICVQHALTRFVVGPKNLSERTPSGACNGLDKDLCVRRSARAVLAHTPGRLTHKG